MFWAWTLPNSEIEKMKYPCHIIWLQRNMSFGQRVETNDHNATTLLMHIWWFAANFNSRRFSIRYFLFHFCAFQLGPETLWCFQTWKPLFGVVWQQVFFPSKLWCAKVFNTQHGKSEVWCGCQKSLVYKGVLYFFTRVSWDMSLYEHLSPNHGHRFGCYSQSTVCFPFLPPKLNMLPKLHSGSNASGSWRRPKVEHWNCGMTHGVLVDILVATS